MVAMSRLIARNVTKGVFIETLHRSVVTVILSRRSTLVSLGSSVIIVMTQQVGIQPNYAATNSRSITVIKGKWNARFAT